jgi:predicted extracellular nuclease
MKKGWKLYAGILTLWLILSLTIENTKAATSLSICQIQGDGFVSPYLNAAVTTHGVVIADFDSTSKKGFYIQDENCDSDAGTSDGIFVYLGSRILVVDVGDQIEVTGSVYEYYGLTEIAADHLDVTVISRGNPLPVPVELNPPQNNTAAR